MTENMLTRVDSSSFLVTLLEDIKDHKKNDSALEMADKHVITDEGRKRLWMNTQGWKLKIL